METLGAFLVASAIFFVGFIFIDIFLYKDDDPLPYDYLYQTEMNIIDYLYNSGLPTYSVNKYLQAHRDLSRHYYHAINESGRLSRGMITTKFVKVGQHYKSRETQYETLVDMMYAGQLKTYPLEIERNQFGRNAYRRFNNDE